MIVTRLKCPECETAIEGQFALGRLALLSPEQLEFVEVYLRCDGKIKRVEQELGVSYPTVRSRLNEIITSMGYELPGSEPVEMTTDERRRVLDDLAAGQISPKEAMDLLKGVLSEDD
jgi:hypothetical protein